MDKYAKKKLQSIVQIICIVVLCLASIILDFVKIPYLKDGLRNGLLSKIIQQACGVAAAILIMVRLRIKLFGRPRKLLFLIPCLIIAIDNFQWASFFNGNMRLINTHPLDILLFIGYCMAVGLFEECIFRGVVFSLLASWFPKNKKGFLWTYVLSSVIFGLAQRKIMEVKHLTVYQFRNRFSTFFQVMTTVSAISNVCVSRQWDIGQVFINDVIMRLPC